MREGTRAELAARLFLTLGALLPYWRLLTFGVVFVTDGVFTSDLFNAELPGRLMVARSIRAGQLPLWTSQICSGYPLTGSPLDPLGLALFTLLPPAAALDLLLIVLLLVAAHGTYSLARRFGANRSGAVLAGIGFAGSGYIVTQLAHLAIISTIVWLPAGLVLIDRVLAGERRSLSLAMLGLVFANQALAGFPQAAYICGLVYGSFALFRALARRPRIDPVTAWLPPLGAIAGALALGAAAGAVVLLPMGELASVSEFAESLDYRWATYTNFWPPNVFTFFAPYIYGDASDGTYIGLMPFTENYGYVGLATAILAVYGAGRHWRRPLVAFLIVMTTTAFAFMLALRTPVFYAAFVLIPGMSRFRAPTRFMVVVDLGLVLLAAIGLTRVGAELRHKWSGADRRPRLIQIGICVATALDLFIHQPRQNPFVPADTWLAPPRTADIVRADTSAPRTFTPQHRDIHRHAYKYLAHGWKDVEPYYKLRDLLEPDIGAGYWNVPSANCYVGLAPRWYVSVWSNHYVHQALIHDSALYPLDAQALVVTPTFATLARAYGVTHVLSQYPADEPKLTLVAREPNAYVYRVEGSARARVVAAARRVPTEAAALARLRDRTFDPDREILLHDAPDSVQPTVDDAGAGLAGEDRGRAAITHENARELVLEAVAPHDGFLLLADMYYPGWRAEVDGMPTPIYRANISVRGIALPKGQHTVRFSYDAAPFFRGLWISLIALGVLLLWLGAAAYRIHA